MALAMYDALTREDITKGKTIAGTGTIDANGNVGAIGGVIYKLSGAVKNNADIIDYLHSYHFSFLSSFFKSSIAASRHSFSADISCISF